MANPSGEEDFANHLSDYLGVPAGDPLCGNGTDAFYKSPWWRGPHSGDGGDRSCAFTYVQNGVLTLLALGYAGISGYLESVRHNIGQKNRRY